MSEHATFVSPRSHWENVRINDRKVIEFPYFGYLSGFEFRFKEPQPNMDASGAPWRVMLTVIGPNGETPDFEIIGQFREVATPDEMRRR